jgi:glycosyltransferase involved in cell wall biosynthesis
MILTSDYLHYTELAGNSSWYYTPGNSSELKLALVELWNSPETIIEIGKRNLKDADKFKLKNLSKKLETLIQI